MNIYKDITPMACKCKDIPERDEILRQLDKIKAPISYLCKEVINGKDEPSLYLEVGYVTENIYCGGYSRNNMVSPYDFLAKFREVYEAHKETSVTFEAQTERTLDNLP